jgi:hypothetical protein
LGREPHPNRQRKPWQQDITKRAQPHISRASNILKQPPPTVRPSIQDTKTQQGTRDHASARRETHGRIQEGKPPPAMKSINKHLQPADSTTTNPASCKNYSIPSQIGPYNRQRKPSPSRTPDLIKSTPTAAHKLSSHTSNSCFDITQRSNESGHH